ncbi:cation:proton antiporter [Candidatus Woesearchaeota archaeon]|nr:cation:proton antiporter [Candidatus Woesearchaeota archaeon]
MNSLVSEIGLILILATFLAFIARRLKQPMILGYIIAGMIIGPLGLKLVIDMDTITTLSELGIAFLLFIVGLEIDVRKLRNLGLIALVAGIGQVVFTFIITYFVVNLLGFSQIHTLYIAIALTLSSTIIIVKLLSDKNEMNALHGRIALGILLVQDFVAVIALAALAKSSITWTTVGVNVALGIAFFAIAIIIGMFILKYVFNPIASSPELLFLGAVSTCFLFAMISEKIGLSIAIGGFLAGICLAPLPYNLEIVSRIKSLRDFFATIFFVTLGMQIVIPYGVNIWFPVFLFSIFVIIGNPLIVLILMSVMGFKARPSFLTGISIAQISEFSLILMALGVSTGMIPQVIMSIIALVAVITFTVSSYMITYDEQLYRLFQKIIKPFEKLAIRKLHFEHMPGEIKYHIILCGCNRVGRGVIESAQKLKKNVLVIDFNPEVVHKLAKEKLHALYGDVGDVEIVERIIKHKPELIISTVPDAADNYLLLQQVKKKHKKVKMILTANNIHEALDLYEEGADYVLLPHQLGRDHIALILREKTKNITKLDQERARHIERIKKRKIEGMN